MLNQIVLVGRLTKNPEIITKENGKKIAVVTLAVQRPYRNSDNLYETDFIRCVLWDGVAQNTQNYCHSGDIIGIKGRLQSETYQDAEGKTKYVSEVIAEKVTFLSSKKEESNQSN